MATLEKIRSKSVLLIIVIGVALLAFIVGDGIKNGRDLFGKGNRLAKVGNAKVEYAEFQQRQNLLQDLYKNADLDQSALSALAIDQLINEKLIDNAVDQLGISVADAELSYYILEQPLAPAQMYLFRNFGQNANPAQAYDMVFNPQKYGISADAAANMKAAWLQMEEETKSAVARKMYADLLAGVIKPNTLDTKDMHSRRNDSYNVNMAIKTFTDDELGKVKVSDEEINKLYEERKGLYAVNQESATIGFVYAKVNASESDHATAEDIKNRTVTEMKAGNGISTTLQKEGVRFNKFSLPAKYIARNYTNLPLSSSDIVNASADTVAQTFSDNYYLVTRKIGVSTANDSVQLAVFEVPAAEVAKLKQTLASGLPADSVAAKSGTKANLLATEWVTVQNPQMRSSLPNDLVAKLDTVAAGEIVTIMEGTKTDNARIAKVEKAIPVTVQEFEVASYELLPSSETLAQAREKMEEFGAKNTTPAALEANASKSGYEYLTCKVDASTPSIAAPDRRYGFQSFPNSSSVISWVMGEGVSGDVSKVFDNNDARDPWIYIAIVADTYDSYRPVTDPEVKKELTTLAKKHKLAADLIKKYSGKGDINATAAAMGVSVMNQPDIRFGSGQPSDLKVSAKMTSTTPGAKVYVVEGDGGVYAYQVAAKNANNTPINLEQETGVYGAIFNSVMQGSNNPMTQYQGIGKMLRGNSKVENNIYKNRAK